MKSKGKSKKPSKQHFTVSRPKMERLAKIQQLIQSGKPHNASSIAKELGICVHTVYRNIEILITRFGHAIEFDHAQNKYIYTSDPVPLPSQHLSELEITAMN